MSSNSSQTKTTKAKVAFPLYCSFCGKSQHDVLALVAGPTVFICDECIELCLCSIPKEVRKKINKGVRETEKIDAKA